MSQTLAEKIAQSASYWESRYVAALTHPISTKMAQFENMKAALKGEEYYNPFIDGAQGVLKAVKAQCPVESGHLRDSLRVEVTDVNSWHRTGHVGDFAVKNPICWIATDVFYAPWVEHGTRYAAPHPFMRPAMDQGARGVATRVGDKVAVSLMKRYIGAGLINV